MWGVNGVFKGCSEVHKKGSNGVHGVLEKCVQVLSKVFKRCGRFVRVCGSEERGVRWCLRWVDLSHTPEPHIAFCPIFVHPF